MKVIFLLPALQVFGSSIVFELSNYLNGFGHEVLITSLDKPVDVSWFPLQNIPIPYDEAIKELHTVDAIIATNCVTAHLVNGLDTTAKKFYLVTEQESKSYTKGMWKMKYPDLPQNRLDIEYKTQINYLEGALDLPMRYLATSTGLVELLKNEHDKVAKHLQIGVDPELFFPDPMVPRDDLSNILVYGDGTPWRGVAEVNTALDGLRGIRIWTVSGPIPAMKTHKHWGNPDTNILRKILSSAEIFINVPWHSGHALLEAQAAACGAAVVTTNTMGAKDIFAHKKNAYIVPQKAPEQIREAVGYFLRSKGENREVVVREGFKLVKTLDWEAPTKKLIEVLKEE